MNYEKRVKLISSCFLVCSFDKLFVRVLYSEEEEKQKQEKQEKEEEEEQEKGRRGGGGGGDECPSLRG